MFVILRFLLSTPPGYGALLRQEVTLAPHLTVLKYHTLQNKNLLTFALFTKIP